MAHEVTPSDSRYVPFVQQPYCCVPACLQMVAYKNELPVLPQEYIGAKLGLVVPPEDGEYFYDANVSDKPVVSSGYGTRIQDPKYSLEAFLDSESWPLRLKKELASQIASKEFLLNRLVEIEEANEDALICLQNNRGFGHVMVFDRIIDGQVRVIDPSPQHAKWQMLSGQDMYERIQKHGDDNFGGLWLLERV